MPPTKEKTKKQKAKRNFVDFIKDASRKGSTVGMDFLNELNKKGARAKDLHQLLIGWGYDGVGLEDCTKLLSIVKSRGRIDHAALQVAY